MIHIKKKISQKRYNFNKMHCSPSSRAWDRPSLVRLLPSMATRGRVFWGRPPGLWSVTSTSSVGEDPVLDSVDTRPRSRGVPLTELGPEPTRLCPRGRALNHPRLAFCELPPGRTGPRGGSVVSSSRTERMSLLPVTATAAPRSRCKTGQLYLLLGLK